MAYPIDHDNAGALASMLGSLATGTEPGESPVMIDSLDGYLTALACGPVLADPLQAVDALLAEDWAANLDAQDATEAFMDALQKRWSEIREALNPERLLSDIEQMQLMPLITEFDEDSQASSIEHEPARRSDMDALPVPGVLWVQGFLRGVQDHHEDWHRFSAEDPLGQEMNAMLAAIAAVTLGPGRQLDAYLAQAYEGDEIVDEDVLLDDALFCVQDLKLFWQRTQPVQALS